MKNTPNLIVEISIKNVDRAKEYLKKIDNAGLVVKDYMITDYTLEKTIAELEPKKKAKDTLSKPDKPPKD